MFHPRFVVQPSPMGRRNAVPASERGGLIYSVYQIGLNYCQLNWYRSGRTVQDLL